MQQSLARRALSSTIWQSASSLITTGVLVVRSILLARLVPINVFGLYGYASSIIAITSMLATFGMAGGFLHRTTETEDEEQAAATHFALKLIFTVVWSTLVVIAAFFVVESQYQPVLLVLVAIHAVIHLTQTPKLILLRRVVHRRLSLLSTIDVLISSGLALALAMWGPPLWALISTDLVTLVVSVIGLFFWRPVWRPKLNLAPSRVRYFLGFGARNFPAGLLAQGLDRIDDIWTGRYLGSLAMGLYGKAYAFATYPRKIIATPLNKVSGGSYAELKGDRKRLSQAFFRINAVLVRSSFLLGGILALIAPEFIRILLGNQWLPMLQAYRLMLVFTLLDPLKLTIADLFTAVGKPERVVYARAIQFIILLIGLVTLGPALGIAGVALAVDAMLVVGIALLFWQARVYVDFSLLRLFGAPTLALAAGLATARGLIMIPGVLGSDWRTGAVKSIAFPLIYLGSLLILERRQTKRFLNWTLQVLKLQTEVGGGRL